MINILHTKRLPLINFFDKTFFQGKDVLTDVKLNLNAADYLLEDFVQFKDSVQIMVLSFPTIVLTTFIMSVYLALKGNTFKKYKNFFFKYYSRHKINQ